jgi:hypothetical protein
VGFEGKHTQPVVFVTMRISLNNHPAERYNTKNCALTCFDLIKFS